MLNASSRMEINKYFFYSKFEEFTALQKFSMDEYRLVRVEQII